MLLLPWPWGGLDLHMCLDGAVPWGQRLPLLSLEIGMLQGEMC
jgi:hypothetical protein